MKKLLAVVAALVLALPMVAMAQEQAAGTSEAAAPAEKAKEFVVYADKSARGNHYIPSGWMGDTSDIKMNDQYAENPHSGTTCIEFVYSAKKSQNQGWAGVTWQNPAQNWGTKKGGFDLTGMTKLTFWARGAKGGEVIDKVKVGGIGSDGKKPYPDSLSVEIGPIELTNDWKQYTVNLSGKDLSYVSGGFAWVANADLNPEGATFYIDDVKFEADATLKPEGKKQEAMPFYVYSDSRSVGNHFIPSGWMPGAETGKDLKLDSKSKDNPYLGETCIKVTYKDNSGNGWAGIYWQNPANNWGDVDGGYDLSKATKVTFWARGLKGGENIQTFKVGGLIKEFADSDAAEIGPVILTKEWKQYIIDLAGKDMSYVFGGFSWTTNMESQAPEALDENGGITFYLDEIKYE
ncbi:MAG: choice-of-anchor J domain-containing protein [Candidatus Omnitrophica bacterium]|nr:choice-of-anchor J domain-containing protein [Candidatus Omnitrophota bacterium]